MKRRNSKARLITNEHNLRMGCNVPTGRYLTQSNGGHFEKQIV